MPGNSKEPGSRLVVERVRYRCYAKSSGSCDGAEDPIYVKLPSSKKCRGLVTDIQVLFTDGTFGDSLSPPKSVLKAGN